MRGRPHTVTACAPKRYQPTSSRCSTPASALNSSTTGGRSDGTQLLGELLVEPQVLFPLLRGGPPGFERRGLSPQPVRQTERLARGQTALLGRPEVGLETLDEVAPAPGKLLNGLDFHVRNRSIGA